jgi:PadR family transcriptional regulator, regulatory protein PadR
MAKGEYLGELEQLVLLAVARLHPNAYGTTIRQELERRAERSLAIGALYAALDRLVSKGCLVARDSEPVAQRGGRSRRLFALTSQGASALRTVRETQKRMWAGLKLRTDQR